MKISVIGTGYVGAVTASCLAWLGHDVIGVDTNRSRVDELAAGQPPFYEPGLADVLKESLDSGRLTFASEIAAMSGKEVVFLCVGTPLTPQGLPDLSQLEQAVVSMAHYLSPGTVVINKSTVPVGSGNWVRTLVEESRPDDASAHFAVVSNPEFLREGSAVQDFLHPNRVVLGGDNGAIQRVVDLYQPILDQQFPCQATPAQEFRDQDVPGQDLADANSRRRPRLFITDLSSAEMIKYAANAFLATKISFANEIAELCELVGADVRQVLPAIGADERIGSRFLRPGVGWGGSCFGKDINALIAIGRDYGYGSPLLRAAVKVNQVQREAIVRKLQHELKVLKGRRVALLGLAFKPDTDDLRDSPALELASRLKSDGCVVSAHDPVVKDLPEEFSGIRTVSDPYEAAWRADAVVVVTEWPQFSDIDPARLRSMMNGSVLIDGRNLLDVPSFEAAGLRVVGVGW